MGCGFNQNNENHSIALKPINALTDNLCGYRDLFNGQKGSPADYADDFLKKICDIRAICGKQHSQPLNQSAHP
jgi:hypothetical protein